MRRFSLMCAIGVLLTFAAVMPVRADFINFEVQAAGRGGVFTGFADSPLTIGLATFTGGELLHAEVGLPADQTGVYATQVFSVDETNPLVISFAAPVKNFSIQVANGGEAQNYTVRDNVGTAIVRALGTAGSGGFATFTLPDTDIDSVQIEGASDGWNFAIDNLSFGVAAPEPSSLAFLTGLLATLATVQRLRRK